ncbi:hypothetical protein [Okeania sp. SIO2B3]|nr:hypothetical protein [Okeania sp. SIO2B3]
MQHLRECGEMGRWGDLYSIFVQLNVFYISIFWRQRISPGGMGQ